MFVKIERNGITFFLHLIELDWKWLMLHWPTCQSVHATKHDRWWHWAHWTTIDHFQCEKICQTNRTRLNETLLLYKDIRWNQKRLSICRKKKDFFYTKNFSVDFLLPQIAGVNPLNDVSFYVDKNKIWKMSVLCNKSTKWMPLGVVLVVHNLAPLLISKEWIEENVGTNT